MSRTIRDFGITPGFLPAGPKNALTDVAGVKVGHWTLHDKKHHTGVTMILPRPRIYEEKCAAAAYVLNGYGKSAGLMQIQELGQMETPIALTNTLNVGLVSDALVELTVRELADAGRALRSVNPVVGECNDAGLNTITERVAGFAQVKQAAESASDLFESGCVGAGAGMTCHGLKGGIGSASRVFEAEGRCWTVGVLGLCNHGELQELTVAGRRIGPQIARRLEERNAGSVSEDRGSCMLIVGTDLPLSDRQLLRLTKRSAVGLARCGSFWGHGSGDIAIGFSTASVIRDEEERCVLTRQVWNEEKLNPAFAAAAEAAEEAVLNALAAAETTVGPDGTVRYALREFADLLA